MAAKRAAEVFGLAAFGTPAGTIFVVHRDSSWGPGTGLNTTVSAAFRIEQIWVVFAKIDLPERDHRPMQPRAAFLKNPIIECCRHRPPFRIVIANLAPAAIRAVRTLTTRTFPWHG